MDLNSNIIIERQFYYAEEFHNGLAKVIRYKDSDYCGNHYQLINFKGEKDTPIFMYNQIKLFSNGFWIAEYGNSPVGKDYCLYSFNILDSNGIQIFDFSKFQLGAWPNCILFSDFEEGILKAEVEDKTYFIDIKGNIILNLEVNLSDISINHGRYFFYRKEGLFGLIDIKNSIIHKPTNERIVDVNIVFPETFFETNSVRY